MSSRFWTMYQFTAPFRGVGLRLTLRTHRGRARGCLPKLRVALAAKLAANGQD
jgi:hypothetical protein